MHWFTDLWKDEDRVLRVHGPVVRFVVISQVVCILGLVTSLVVTIVLAASRIDENTARLNAVQESRRGATYDQCLVLRHLIYGAFGPTYRARAHDLLKANDLLNCRYRARSLVRLP